MLFWLSLFFPGVPEWCRVPPKFETIGQGPSPACRAKGPQTTLARHPASSKVTAEERTEVLEDWKTSASISSVRGQNRLDRHIPKDHQLSTRQTMEGVGDESAGNVILVSRLSPSPRQATTETRRAVGRIGDRGADSSPRSSLANTSLPSVHRSAERRTGSPSRSRLLSFPISS